VRVRSEGDVPDATEPRFGQATERRYQPFSTSVGAVWKQGPWAFSGHLGHTERAPAYYELYANGLHLATAAFEQGDPSLGLERSQHLEAGLAWAAGGAQFKLNLFHTRFGRYIALDATGQTVDVDGEAVAGYRFSGVPARLQGLEAEVQWPLAGGFSLQGGLDLVRGDNLATGEPLPRLAPLRLRAGLAQQAGAWRWGADVRHAATQNRVPGTDTPTPGHTLLNLWAQWQTGADVLWFAKLDNATDRLATSATTVGTLRGLAPLAGRALTLGWRLAL
jgi:iron complex outermembrane receptor protein